MAPLKNISGYTLSCSLAIFLTLLRQIHSSGSCPLAEEAHDYLTVYNSLSSTMCPVSTATAPGETAGVSVSGSCNLAHRPHHFEETPPTSFLTPWLHWGGLASCCPNVSGRQLLTLLQEYRKCSRNRYKLCSDLTLHCFATQYKVPNSRSEPPDSFLEMQNLGPFPRIQTCILTRSLGDWHAH